MEVFMNKLLFLLLLSVVICGSCVHLEQEICIFQNGSARFTYHYSVAESNYQLLLAQQGIIDKWQGKNSGNNAQDMNCIFNQVVAEQYFKGKDIELKEYKSYIKNGRRDVKIMVMVADVREALATKKFGDFRLSKEKDGHYLLKADIPSIENGKKISKKEKKLLAEKYKGLKLKLTIITPTDITKTTAKKKEKREAVWCFDVDKDSSFLYKTPIIELKFQDKDLLWSNE